LEAEGLYRWTSRRSGYLAEANVDYVCRDWGFSRALKAGEPLDDARFSLPEP